ncbi:MAG: hypothetical protein AAGG48_29080 [Planctomycetota bacterium]
MISNIKGVPRKLIGIADVLQPARLNLREGQWNALTGPSELRPIDPQDNA